MRTVKNTSLAVLSILLVTMVAVRAEMKAPPKECNFNVRDEDAMNRFVMYYYDLEKIGVEDTVSTPHMIRYESPQIYNDKGIWAYWDWDRKFTKVNEAGTDLIVVDPLVADPLSPRMWAVQDEKIKMRGSNSDGYDKEFSYEGARITAINPGKDVVWFGTEGGGIFSLDRTITGKSKKIYSKSNSGLPDNNITALDWENNVLWIGTKGGGAAAFDGSAWRAFNMENGLLPSNQVNALIAVSGDEAWAGTQKGLFHLRGKTTEKVNTPFRDAAVDSVERDFLDRIWVAAGGKIYVLDEYGWKTFDPTSCASPDARIDRITLDGEGQIWVAEGRHLFKTIFSSTKPTPVTGKVVDRNGTAIENTIVTSTSRKDRSVTDEEGRFTLELVQSGIIAVSFNAPGLDEPITRMIRHYHLSGGDKTDIGVVTLPVSAVSPKKKTTGREARIAVLAGGKKAELKIINDMGRVFDEIVLPFTIYAQSTNHISWCSGNKRIMVSRSITDSDQPVPFFLVDMIKKEVKNFTLPNGALVKGKWASCSPARDEAVIVFADNIWRINLDGTGMTQITKGSGDVMYEMPQFSHDGNSIVFLKGKEKIMDVWWVDREGKEAKPLVVSEEYKGFPSYSPDGKSVAYFTFTKDFRGIASVGAPGEEGKPPFDRLNYGQTLYEDISWLPGGNGLLFFSAVDYYQLVKYDTDTGSSEIIFPTGVAVAAEN